MSVVPPGAPSRPVPPPASAPAPFAYLETLNPEQRRAVEAIDGPVLVLAGAGTGKTRVLTTRLAHILATRRAFPSQILAVTFTNKAAREMRDRLDRLIGSAADGLWLGTFHALAARILRRHAELVGLRSDFTILDTDDQVRLMKQILSAEDIDDKRWPARAVLSVVERCKDRGLAPDKVSAAEAGDIANGRIVSLYRAYQERLKTLNAVDFGDLLLHNLTIFQSEPRVLDDYQRRFRYLLVDEYQDTNVAQYLWLRLLALGHHNICCVGDDDQSIYGWRGAEIENILKFERDFPGAETIRLERNYRSTPQILAVAGYLIAHNQGRLGKTLWTDGDAGEKVKLRGVWDSQEEARWVADEIEAEQRRGTSLAEIAVLVRAGFQTREFEERFIATAIPYRVIGGPRFYERQEIRDALAYLRLVRQPSDDLAFERIVNLPRRGIGATTLQALHAAAREAQQPLLVMAAELARGTSLKPAARSALGRLAADFERWHERSEALSHIDLVQLVLDESGYTAMWQADRSAEAPGRLENLKELVVAMAGFDTLAGFLEHVALVMENTVETGTAQVTVMTMHAAKGLEFDVVFLPGWEEGLFPHQRALDENGMAGLEEERRLAYVGLTRARRRAMVSFAANRRIHGNWASALPSRFVGELPKEWLDIETATGLGMGAPRGFGAGRYDTGSWDSVSPMRQSFAERQSFAGRGTVIDARPVTPRAPARAGSFAVGDRVFHQKFGEGTIRGVENDKLTVLFDQAGEKKVMDAFVSKAEAEAS